MSRPTFYLLLIVAAGCGDDSSAADASAADTMNDARDPGDSSSGDVPADVSTDAVLPIDAADAMADITIDDATVDTVDATVDAGFDVPMIDAGPSRCAEFPGAFFCDGFEDESAWTSYTGTEASAAPLYRGRFSRRASFPEPVQFNALSAVFLAFDAPFAPATFHMRAYVHLDGDLDHRSLSLMRLGAGPTTYFLFVGRPDATSFLDGTGGAMGITGEGFPRNRWVCLQLAITPGPTETPVQIRVDGADLVSGNLGGTNAEFINLQLGLLQLAGGGEVTTNIGVSMDEVVLSDVLIPCD